MIKLTSFITVAFILLFGVSAPAQWSSDSTVNTPVCTAVLSQQNPQICSDGNNGAIIVWEDSRNGHDVDIYAQRLSSNGVAQWAKDGINICVSAANQTAPVIAGD